MGEYKDITRGQLFIRMMINPIFIAVYWFSFYNLYTLCKFGRMNNNLTMLLLCLAFFVIYLIIFIVRIFKKPITIRKRIKNRNIRLAYGVIALIFMFSLFIFYGGKIYKTSMNFNGKLSWILKDLKDKKTVELKHNNIYEDGIEGILQDINKKVPMVQKLYIANNVDLKFDKEGTITSFNTFLYGKNDKDTLESYLISYNKNESSKITIYLHGNVNGDFNEDKLLEPLISTMKVIPLKETISKWEESQFGILYSGKRSFGYNGSGVLYIDSEGKTRSVGNRDPEIIGYAVSVYVPGKESTLTPYRYILVDDLNNIKSETLTKGNKEQEEEESNGIDKFYLSQKIGYKLEVTDAAAGSRAYALEKTLDGGTKWSLVNGDPFLGEIGAAAGITFLDERLGFLCLAHSGGARGELYRTEDGGTTFTKISFPEVKVPLNGSEPYNPFDLPGMPTKEGENLNISVGQGSDGDYNGGIKALYRSKDQGKTWEYVKEAKN